MKARLPIFTLSLAGIALAIQGLPGASTVAEFSRAAVAGGEWWRFFSAHVAHFDANHLLWDVGVFTTLGWVCETESRARMVAALALAAGAITAAVWLWQPRFEVYRGLSGLDCALFGVFTGSLLRRPRPLAKWVGAVGLLAAAAKCIFELATGSTFFASGNGYEPVPLAHLVGLLAGLAASLSFEMHPRDKRRSATARVTSRSQTAV